MGRLFEDPRLVVRGELLEWFPPRSISYLILGVKADWNRLTEGYFFVFRSPSEWLSSWAIVEAMGWQKTRFFWVYVAESLPAVLVPIFYPDPLALVLGLMVTFVFVLAGPGILMGKLASDTRVIGGHVSKGPMKVAYWLSLAAILSFGFVAVFATL